MLGLDHPSAFQAAFASVHRRRSSFVSPHWPDDVTTHLDAGYDSTVTRTLLHALGLHGEIARKGVRAPIQVGKRWVRERTHSWMNGYGKLRRATDHDGRSRARSGLATWVSSAAARDHLAPLDMAAAASWDVNTSSLAWSGW